KLGDVDPATLSEGHAVGPRPAARHRLLDGSLVAREQVVVAIRHATRRAGRRSCGLFGLAVALGAGDLVELALGVLFLTPHPLLLGAQLLQLPLALLAGQAAFLLGLLLLLAFGQLDLLLAAALLLLAFGGQLRLGIGAGLVLVD